MGLFNIKTKFEIMMKKINPTTFYAEKVELQREKVDEKQHVHLIKVHK